VLQDDKISIEEDDEPTKKVTGEEKYIELSPSVSETPQNVSEPLITRMGVLEDRFLRLESVTPF
jgi:hypothetical protein